MRRLQQGKTLVPPQVMERVNITIGPLTFDHADYDAEGDVLYLHVGEPQEGEGEETPEGMSCATRRIPTVLLA